MLSGSAPRLRLVLPALHRGAGCLANGGNGGGERPSAS